jgi:hypothetical protein
MDKPIKPDKVTTHMENGQSGPLTTITGRVRTFVQEKITGVPSWKKKYLRLPTLKNAPRAGWRRSKH